MKNIILLFLCILFQNANAQFFTQYWATFEGKVSNSISPHEILRAHDESITVQ